MTEVLELQVTQEPPSTPGEEKNSLMSYLACTNSMVSTVFCETLG